MKKEMENLLKDLEDYKHIANNLHRENVQLKKQLTLANLKLTKIHKILKED